MPLNPFASAWTPGQAGGVPIGTGPRPARGGLGKALDAAGAAGPLEGLHEALCDALPRVARHDGDAEAAEATPSKDGDELDFDDAFDQGSTPVTPSSVRGPLLSKEGMGGHGIFTEFIHSIMYTLLPASVPVSQSRST